MIVIVKIKDAADIIGAKENIASMFETICDVERIDVYNNEINIEQKG